MSKLLTHLIGFLRKIQNGRVVKLIAAVVVGGEVTKCCLDRKTRTNK